CPQPRRLTGRLSAGGPAAAGRPPAPVAGRPCGGATCRREHQQVGKSPLSKRKGSTIHGLRLGVTCRRAERFDKSLLCLAASGTTPSPAAGCASILSRPQKVKKYSPSSPQTTFLKRLAALK